ncbi:hypothetical protein L7F22_010569 [Adiantum nelumboides]|nr:hypothetical protein [Adiantum nelumboides]
MQESKKGWFRPVYYANRVLSDAERNYAVTEREGLGMVYALKKFRHYLLANKVMFHVDHQALIYLVKKPQLSGRLARWILLLQEFDYSVVHTPGKEHAIADYMSRIENGELSTEIDEFPDAGLFQATVGFLTVDWYDDMLQHTQDEYLPPEVMCESPTPRWDACKIT